MKTFVAISGLAGLAAAAPRGFPPSTTDRIDRSVPSSIQPGGIMLPTGSVLPSFSGSGFSSFPTGSGFAFPSGGFPKAAFPTGAFPTGGFPTGAFPSGGFPFPSDGFHHHHHGTGELSGAAAPTGFATSVRDSKFEVDAASFAAPIASGSAFSFPTAAQSFSFPAFGSGASESGFAKPTGFGSGEHSFSLPAFGSGGLESGVAKPTGFAKRFEHKGHHHEGTGVESGFAKPTGSFSFSLPTESGSGFALPTGFGKVFEHKGHHHEGTGVESGFAKPTGSFSFSLPTESGSGFALPTDFGKGAGSVSGFAAPTGGFPTGSFSGLPSGSFSFAKPTETASF